MFLKDFPMENRLVKSLPVLLIPVILLFLLSSCGGPDRIPEAKKDFIGVWQSPSGFQIQIMSEGTANVYQPIDSLHPDYERLRLRKANAVYNFGFEVEFLGDTVLNIKKPYHSGRLYRIDMKPFMDADTMKMAINGVVVKKYDEEFFMADF